MPPLSKQGAAAAAAGGRARSPPTVSTALEGQRRVSEGVPAEQALGMKGPDVVDLAPGCVCHRHGHQGLLSATVFALQKPVWWGAALELPSLRGACDSGFTRFTGGPAE